MMIVPDTFEEMHRQAYKLGYSDFHFYDAKDLVRGDIDLTKTDSSLYDYERIRVSISESDAQKTLWRTLEHFYEQNASDELYLQFKRESAVAEDFVTSFEAGAYAALRNDEYDPEDDLSMFLDQ